MSNIIANYTRTSKKTKTRVLELLIFNEICRVILERVIE